MSQWDLFAAYFTGIPYGEYICSVFIVGLCAFALWKARRIYRQL